MFILRNMVDLVIMFEFINFIILNVILTKNLSYMTYQKKSNFNDGNESETCIYHIK